MTGWRRIFASLLLSVNACTGSGEVLHVGDGTAGPGTAGAGGNPPVVLHESEVRLSTGQMHACRVASGVLSCWGQNSDGQLGVAASGNATGQGPVIVAGGNWLVPAAGERHTCALASSGNVSCWGANDVGQLGAGDRAASAKPRAVTLPVAAIDLRTSFNHSCALLADASLWCWGDNLEGQLGLADRYPGDAQLSPAQVSSARDWVFVAAGQGHSCGIRSPGALYCWGRNTESQLGQGSADPQQIRTPTRVGIDDDWVEVGVGQGTSCARKRDKTLYCWGKLASGVLAVGDLEARPTPARIPDFNDWSSFASATFHTCGIRGAAEIWCAGRNAEGQIGLAELSDANPSMQQSDPGTSWLEVRAGRFFTCARKLDDSVWCMGSNRERELGQDTAVDHSAVMLPVQ
jgi:alpha-tubulin suppressor-like RCC1 family protein